MIIVQIVGGLGNQLFGYALFRKLLSMGKDVYIDTVSNDKRGIAAAKCKFGLYRLSKESEHRQCSKKQRRQVADIDMDLFSLVKRKIMGQKKKPVKEKREFCFDRTVFELDDVYLSGYWQSYKYFEDIRSILLEELELVDEVNDSNKKYLNLIRQTNSISLHIRRGDYLLLQDTFGDICTDEYYENAIQYIKEHVNNPVFFVFSNDPKWCKDRFGGEENFYVVDINDDEHGYWDLNLMKNCKHNIIANSSFSWWGAWLNDYKNRITIAPTKWINNLETPDIIPSEWVTISSE